MAVEKITLIDLIGKNGKLSTNSENVNNLLQNNVGRFVKVTIEFQDEPPTIPQYRYLYGCVYVELQAFIAQTQGLYLPIDKIDLQCKEMFFWSDEIDEKQLKAISNPKKKSRNGKTALSHYIDSIVIALENEGWLVPNPYQYAASQIKVQRSQVVYRGNLKFKE